MKYGSVQEALSASVIEIERILTSDAKVMFGGGGASGAKREGSQAVVDGKPRTSNPYKEGTKEREAWFKGWDAQTEARKS